MPEDPFAASKLYWKNRRRQGWRTGENWVPIYATAALLPTVGATILIHYSPDLGSPKWTLTVLVILAGFWTIVALVLVGLSHLAYLGIRSWRMSSAPKVGDLPRKPPANLLE